MVTVFFDLKNAFDSVSHQHLLFKLAKVGIKGKMLKWIKEYLFERTYQIMIGDEKSDVRELKRGVPQGSNLSPILFNIMMADIPHSEDIHIMEYADDIAISIIANTVEEASNRAKAAIETLENWAKESELSFNPSKTKAMVFTKKMIMKDPLNGKQILPTLKVKGEEIEWTQEFRYLGVILDGPTLTWKNHIKNISKVCHERLNIFRALTGTSWGADRNLIITMYNAYIRSKITYGIIAVASASNTNLKILERIQNMALRIAIGARRTSPIAALEAEAGILPIRDHLKEISSRYYYKVKGAEILHK